jgi:hypothetical protein
MSKDIQVKLPFLNNVLMDIYFFTYKVTFTLKMHWLSYLVWILFGLVSYTAREPLLNGRLSTVDLLIKIACFVPEKKIFLVKK